MKHGILTATTLVLAFAFAQPAAATLATTPIDTQSATPMAQCDAALQPAEPSTVLAVVMSARQLLGKDIDPRQFANNIDKLVRGGNVWPMWVCQYADGTLVYNKFRWYRDAAAVLRYFTGRPDEHDCDARVFKRYEWCTQYAAQFAAQHGGIVSAYSIE